MAALSAATGLSPQDINNWASNLPAGTTFKVTHHYDQSLAVSKAASTLMKQTSPSVSSPRSLDHAIFRQQRQQLTLEMASSACHDSLISACVGLPSYQESFAVDPNEILSKDRATRVSKNHFYFWFYCGVLLLEHRLGAQSSNIVKVEKILKGSLDSISSPSP